METITCTRSNPGSNSWIITITKTRKKWFFFGPEVSKVRKYRGNCTVWMDVTSDSPRRASIKQDLDLYKIWRIATWKEEDEENEKKDN